MPANPSATSAPGRSGSSGCRGITADGWAPPIDVYETADALRHRPPSCPASAASRSSSPSRIRGSTIQGRREARPGAGDAVHYHQVERGHGAFPRTFEFADKIDVERVTADLTDGVLTVTLPKVPPPPPRKIEVR